MFIASLPWYDFAEVQAANDELWSLLAARLSAEGFDELPEELERVQPYEQQWRSQRFLFGQACGYDVALSHREHLRLLATPVYDVPGCEGPSYRSFVVVREDSRFASLADLAGAKLAINGLTSHSGMNCLRSLLTPPSPGEPFFGELSVTGSHEGSVAALAGNSADVAAIDCISYAHLARHRPSAVAALRILAASEPMPAPPFVTSRRTPEEQIACLRSALEAVLQEASSWALRRALFLDRIELLDPEHYEAIAFLEERWTSSGFRLA